MSDTNYIGNGETRKAIEQASQSDLGPQADKHAGIAQAFASLNIAESLQMFQQVMEVQVQKIIESNEKLAKSNDKHSDRMYWLTAALLFVGTVQAASALLDLFK